MKKFLKKASVYLLVLLLIAAAVFSLNYFLGRRLARDLEADLREIAQENGYRLRYLSLNTNPLLRRVEIHSISLIKSAEQDIEINGAELEFSWQQIFNYLKEREFLAKKDIKANIDKFSFYDLQQNNNFTFYNSNLNYQGELNSSNLKNPVELTEADHQITVLSEEVDYGYPYYRSYGFNKDNWERISNFKAFAFNLDYQSGDNSLKVNDFVLKNEFIDYELDFETVILVREPDALGVSAETDPASQETTENQEIYLTNNALNSIIIYQDQNNEIILSELKSNNSLLLNGELLNINENEIFKDFGFEEFNLSSDFEMNLDNEQTYYRIQKFDLDFDLVNFKLDLRESLSRELSENTFGILAQEDDFSIMLDSLSYQQRYNYPEGRGDLKLISNLLDAELEAEFNYSQQNLYVSNSRLRFKAKNPSVEQLILFAQLLYGAQFEQDQDGYYYLEGWGNLDDFNFE